MLKVSFCDGPFSVVHRPSVRAFVINFFKQHLLWNHLLDFDQTSQEYRFSKCNFKNLLVRNYKAQSFHIWYIASSRGPLPKLFTLCHYTIMSQNWLRPGGQNITLNYKRKTSNDIFSLTANGNLTKLHRNLSLGGPLSKLFKPFQLVA